MTITHGILSVYASFDRLAHEMKEINHNDSKRENLEVKWKKTKVYDNSNRGQKKAIYLERWR